MSKKSKVSKLTSWNIREYLKAIHRTHILYDCDKLNGTCVSYKTNHCVLFNDRCIVKPKELVGLTLKRGNGLERKGGKDTFMKQAVLDRLSTLAKRIVGNEKFVLEEFLVDYEKAFNFKKEELPKSSLSDDKRIDQAAYLFDYFISYKESKNTIFNSLFEKDKGYGQVATILILIILKILPPFKGNHYEKSSIIEDFKTLYDFCIILEGEKKPDSLVPEMLLFKKIHNKLSGYLNNMEYGNGKIVVFNFAYKLFKSISSHLDKESLYFMNKKRKQNGYSGYDIDGFWEEESDPNKLWEIKKIKNGPECHSEYIIREWWIYSSNNNEKKTYKYLSYLFLFTDKSHVYVRGPKYVYYMIQEQKPTEIPDNEIKDFVDYLKVETGDKLEPQKLEFESEVSSNCRLPKCLKRSKKSFHINGTPKSKEDYYFTPALHAVTHNAVYIEADKGSTFPYYRIPVNVEKYKSLSHIDSSDTAGIVKIGDKKYLAFFDQDIFIDSEEKGIEKVSILITDIKYSSRGDIVVVGTGACV